MATVAAKSKKLPIRTGHYFLPVTPGCLFSGSLADAGVSFFSAVAFTISWDATLGSKTA